MAPIPPPIITSPRPKPRPSADEDQKRRIGKKLQKKRANDSLASMDLPDRLKGGAESEEEDLVPSQGPPMMMNMNQSIFGLIAAAGSRADFHDRFDGHSSDDDSGQEGLDDGHKRVRQSRDKAHRHRHHHRNDSDVSKTTVLDREPSSKSSLRRRVSSSSSKLARSLVSLPSLSRHKSRKEPSSKLNPPSEDVSESSDVPATPLDELPEEEQGHRLAPVMSRMLEASTDVTLRPSFDVERAVEGEQSSRRSTDAGPSPLARRLAEIFEFSQAEEVIEGKQVLRHDSRSAVSC